MPLSLLLLSSASLAAPALHTPGVLSNDLVRFQRTAPADADLVQVVVEPEQAGLADRLFERITGFFGGHHRRSA